MNLAHAPRRRVNCIPDPCRKSERKTLCGLVYDRLVYGAKRRTRATCDACSAALLATREMERCKVCGGGYRAVWWADDALWTRLTERLGFAPGAGLVCPTCFDDLAEEAGMALRWVPEVLA